MQNIKLSCLYRSFRVSAVCDVAGEVSAFAGGAIIDALAASFAFHVKSLTRLAVREREGRGGSWLWITLVRINPMYPRSPTAPGRSTSGFFPIGKKFLQPSVKHSEVAGKLHEGRVVSYY